MGAFCDFLNSVMRAVGYAICHQLPDRSLAYGGRALPVCARDTGIFLGFVATLIVLSLIYRRRSPRYPEWPKMVCLALFVAPTVLDALTAYAGLRESSNALRLITGALAGTGIAALLFPFIAGAVASALSFEPEADEPVMLSSWWSLAALLVIPAAVSLATWPDWPGAFWAWSLAVTLAILLTMFALNFTLVILVRDYVAGPGGAPAAGFAMVIALAAALLELALSNRLHWLVQKVL
jgi:uncharacterized membrane protein